MYKVFIFGAGSIGNHLSFGCRTKDWEVTIFDVDVAALERTRSEIFPARYGKWDPAICLTNSPQIDRDVDLVIIGTPPDIHLDNTIDTLKMCQPKVLLIEKPIVAPSKENIDLLRQVINHSGSIILAGYNHNLCSSTLRAEELLANDYLGKPLSLHVRWLEHWGGIFEAHPWLKGPQDSYLGTWSRGGGACAEHSHAISLWHHFSKVLGYGEIAQVNATMDMQTSELLNYDQTTMIGIESKNGLVGSVMQDVVTWPAEKMMRIQGTGGFLEWYANYDASHDALVYGSHGEDVRTEKFEKTRRDDFVGEIDHIEKLLQSDVNNSPLSIGRAINVMEVIVGAHESHQKGEVINL